MSDWASGFVKDILHEEFYRLNKVQPTSVDIAVVTAEHPRLTLRLTDRPVTYLASEIFWAFNPSNLRQGDQILLNKDSQNRPIGVGLVTGDNQDPTLHPKGEAIRKDLSTLLEQVKTWRQPVGSSNLLPMAGNFSGETRLVLDTNVLVRWNQENSVWEQVGSKVTTLAELEDVDVEGVSDSQLLSYNMALQKWVPVDIPNSISALDDLSDVNASFPVVGESIFWDGVEWVSGFLSDPTKLPLAGGTMTGDIVMSSGTAITLPDAPLVGTDAANKDYVDSVVSSPNLVVVATAVDYSVLAADNVILADPTSSAVTITLPNTHSSGRAIYVKDRTGMADVNPVVVQPSGGDTVDGSASFSLTVKYQSVMVVSDGTNWSLI